MSTSRNSIQRRSLPVIIPKRSQILASEQRRTDSVHLETYHLKNDLGIYTDLLSFYGHRSELKAKIGLQAVNSQLCQGEERASMISPLPDDTVNKLETAGTKISRETLLRENKLSYNDSRVTYVAGIEQEEVKTILKKQATNKQTNTFPSEMGPKQLWLKSNKVKTATKTVRFKLPSIFEENTDFQETRMIYNNSRKYDAALFEKEPLRLKVKNFLQKPQPKASEPSLRTQKYPDAQFPMDGEELGNNHSTSKNTDLPGKGMGVPINTNTCPLFSHFKDRKWYYQDKTGKCRYLRVPESPIPPVSYVFENDH